MAVNPIYDDESRRLIAQAFQAPFLEDGEDRKLGRLMKAGGVEGERARARLVASHERLVVSMAKKYLRSGKSFSALISEGKVGLVQAVNKYDPKRGKFATYACWWIRAAIQEFAYGADDPVDLKAGARKKLAKIRRVEKALLESGEEASEAAIAAKAKLSVVTVRRLLERSANPIPPTVSLDDLVGEGSTTLGDILVIEDADNPEQSLEREELKRVMRRVVESIGDERERIIVSMRFGLVDDENVTLEVLADQFGVSKERVRQIETRALARIAAGPHGELLRSLYEAL